jgi:hypothetical protein
MGGWRRRRELKDRMKDARLLTDDPRRRHDYKAEW